MKAPFTKVHWRYINPRNKRGVGRLGFIACNFAMRVPPAHATHDMRRVTCKSCKRIVGIL
jgi:hypothetical protein